MALKKSHASYRDSNGKIVPQRDIDMHPLEEAATLKHWAVHDEKIKLPPIPIQNQEHEWLIEFGADYVKQKREEWKAAYEVQKPFIDAAESEFQKAHNYWNKHVELCVANGHDYDTFEGDANLLLKMPEGNK